MTIDFADHSHIAVGFAVGQMEFVVQMDLAAVILDFVAGRKLN